MLDKNGERMLAYTVTVDSITPIEKADNIELAHVGGWNVIIRKNEFNVGDMAVFFEIDSLLPETEWSEFLRPKKFKVKTYKLGKFNVVSQGLLMPMSILPNNKEYAIHEDVTKLLGVKYYVADDNDRKAKSNPNAKYNNMCARNSKLAKKKWWKWLMKRAWGRKLLFVFFGRKKDNPKNWPVWVKKTDEDRIENVMFMLEDKNPYVVTEKIDGCLDYSMNVMTDSGRIPIGKIVNQQLDVNILTYNEKFDRCEYKPIENYHKWERVSDMYDITFKQKGGRGGNKPKHVRCTSEHSFYCGNGKYIKAKDLTADIIVYHKYDAIDSIAKDILLGILLGDGSLSTKNGMFASGVDFSHSDKQSEYFYETVRLIGEGNCSVRNIVSGYGSNMLSCHVCSNDEFNNLAEDICWNGTKKYVSSKWANSLSPISLAFWYMDDGTIANSESKQFRPTITIATNGFSYEECHNLATALKNKYGIESSIRQKESYKGNTLYFDTVNTDKFCALVAPYIVESMKYKLPDYLRCIKYCLKDYVSYNKSKIIETNIIDIKKVEDNDLPKYVYDLTVKDNHNYFVHGILTHNTSTTFFLDLTGRKPDFGVCSRNVRQMDADQKNFVSDMSGIGNVYWEMAFKYDVEDALKDIAKKRNHKHVVLQGETYGESVQGNKYKLDERRFAAFNLIFDGERLGSVEAKKILAEYDIPFVPIIDDNYILPDADDFEEFKQSSDGKSVINKKCLREGFVYRSQDGQKSFKNVSRKFLLKSGE